MNKINHPKNLVEINDDVRGIYSPNKQITQKNIYRKNFFDQLINNMMKTYENIRKITIGQGHDYTTGCLLDYS